MYKMTNKRLFYIFIFFAFMQCKDPFLVKDRRYTLFLKNNSASNLRYYIAFGNYGPKISLAYPDTSISDIIPYDEIINAGKDYVIYESSVKLKDVYEDLPGDTLSIYLFHADTLAKYSIDEIREDYKVLQRYDLSVEDLEYLNYKLSYPPDAKMSGVKMYPPYP